MKKQTKALIILSLVVLVLIVGIILLVTNKELKLESKISTTWGKTYYKYLKDTAVTLDPENKIHKYNINFYEIKDLDDPILVLEYIKDNKKYSNINFIYNNEIRFMNADDPTTIELLYNKKKKVYDYYTNMISSENGNFYEDLKSQLVNSTKDAEDTTRVTSDSYYFSDKNNNKFEDVFEKVKVDKEEITLNTDSSSEELATAIAKKIKEYKTIKELTEK
ncbi:MAG: hypothetical protein IJI43_03845 [Bacilli bacterium]|nr:hypothetical protein [Bacilli bacterium]